MKADVPDEVVAAMKADVPDEVMQSFSELYKKNLSKDLGLGPEKQKELALRFANIYLKSLGYEARDTPPNL